MISLSILRAYVCSLITLQPVIGHSLGKKSEQMTKLSIILKSDKYHSEEEHCFCCDIKSACQGRQKNTNSVLLCA